MKQLTCLLLYLISSTVTAAEPPDFNAQVMPVFRKHCNGCHNGREQEGGLVLEDFARALKGGENGAVIQPGKSGESRLWKLVSGQSDPKMPPEDQPQPTKAELEIIKAWIDAGAKAPKGGLAAVGLVTPKIAPQATVREPITALAADPRGRFIAVARPTAVEILALSNRQPLKTLSGHAGAVADVQFSADGSRLIVAAGETGLAGEATLWDTSSWTRTLIVSGHRDGLYSASLSADGQTLGTASYDREIRTWNARTGEPLATMQGHSDAVYCVAFHPGGKLLASASGDRTIKLWDVASGQRLDTLAQPSKEQYSVSLSPDGRFIAAGGVDCRIRVWEITQGGKEGTNPILYARFAHEGPILKVAFSPNGRLLVSTSEDRRIKVWETRTFTQVALLERQTDWPSAVCFTADSSQLLIGRMNGEVAPYAVDPRWADFVTDLQPLPESTTGPQQPMPSALPAVAEAEPNNAIDQAQPLQIPAQVNGVFQAAQGADVDLYRIEAKAGQVLMLETNAARSKSPADTKIEVLHRDGRPVQRAILQAVRDSWITFRPIDSSQLEPRFEFWEEMDLNQYVYMNGEVCKLYRAPRGPDSGYELYQNAGKRRTYFDTTPIAQAKEQPIYIVEAFPPNARLIDNGLPTFPLDYVNDDDGQRELGSDSRLTFTAPADDSYLVRITDSRGFTGEKLTYQLTIRPPQPNFVVKLETPNAKLPAGSGQRLRFSVDRIDNLDGPIEINVTNLPAGYHVANPTVIEAGHLTTFTVLSAAADAQPADKAAWEQVVVVASADVHGQRISKPFGSLGTVTLEKPGQIRASLLPDSLATTAADGGLVIAPGTTITALIRVERNGFDGDVKFDVDNLPHGIIVDNIGLSGVLVRANETERQIFLTARPWVPESTRWIHAVGQSQGNPASAAIPLHVRKSPSVAAKE